MKSTKAEIAQRVEEVLRIRLDGAEFHDIVQYASEKAWKVGERQLRNYMAATDDLLAARLEKDRDKLLARHIAQRRSLYARALNAADYRTALAVAKDEAEGIRLIHESAKQGYAPAQSFLGGMYAFGIRKDFAQAQFWYRKAAGQGDEEAERALESLEQEMKDFIGPKKD